ncbi:putative choline transporter, neither null mutation nor overexpression affects choline transport [Rhizoclosmatium sp. JEL0117]|nr:putative choline transporter, neither null mutation nor overexpression affects choline transport [Rhizoclosmatium sp. JEL0117]
MSWNNKGQSQDPLIQAPYQNQGYQQSYQQPQPGYQQQYTQNQSQYQYQQPQYAPPQQNYYQQQQQQQPPSQSQFAYGTDEENRRNQNAKPVPPSNPPQFVQRPKFHDAWAALLFALFIAGFVVMAYLGVPKVIDSLRTGVWEFPNGKGSQPAKTGTTTTGTNNTSASLATKDVFALLGCSVGTGLGFSIIYFFLMLNFPGPLISFSYFFNVLLLLAAAGYAFQQGVLVMAIIYLVFAVLVGLSYFWVRSRIPFSKLVLETVCRITAQFNGTLFVAFGGVVFSAAWSVLWLVTVLGMAQFASSKGLSDTVSIILLVVLVFINFWFSEVVRNTVHVAVCGTFASYFFLGIQQPNSNKVTLPTNHTTASSLKRALTTSFGSICFGSLLVSLIRTLKFIAQIARQDAAQDGNIICCLFATCLECILSCMADILDFFNKYAYTEIAIYGKPYCDAGKDTWNLIKYKGIDLIINDCMIGQVLGMGSFFTALICAFAGWLYVHFNNGLGSLGNDVAVYIVTCLICAIIGAWLFLVLLEVVDSGTSATFVCLAEDPATIQRTLPRLFAQVQERFPEVNWGMQSNAYH